MKKKMTLKLLSMALAVTTVAASVPVYASPALTSEDETSVSGAGTDEQTEPENEEDTSYELPDMADMDANEAEDMADMDETEADFDLSAEAEAGPDEAAAAETTSEGVEPFYSLDDLMAMDYKNMSEKDLTDMFAHAEEDALYLFLDSLTQEEYDRVTSLAYFSYPVQITTYDIAEDGTLNEIETKEMSVLENLLANFKDEEQRAKWKADSFDYYIRFRTAINNLTVSYKITCTGIDTSQDTSITQKDGKIKLTKSLHSGEASLSSINKDFAPTINFQKLQSGTYAGNYYIKNAQLVLDIGYSKPQGYTVGFHNVGPVGSVTFNGLTAGTLNTVIDNDAFSSKTKQSGTLIIDLTKNSVAGGAVSNTYATAFELMPQYYAISGLVGNTLIGTVTYLPASGTPASYKVTYNGNGAPNPAPSTGTRPVASWNLGALGAAFNPSVGGAYTLTPASYGDNGVTLPAVTGKTFTASFDNGTVQRAAQEFTGWYNGSVNVGNAAATYKPGKDVTLTAGWKNPSIVLPKVADKAYTVTFDADGGTLPEKIQPQQTLTYDAFAGWDDASTDEVENYTGSMTLSKDMTLKAAWKAMETTITVPEDVLSKDGYDFLGWSVNGEKKQPGEKITVTSDTVVKALWKLKDTPTPIIPEVNLDEIKDQMESMQKLLNSISSTQSLTSTQVSELSALIKTMYNMSNESAQELMDIIKNSSMSEEMKLKIMQALSQGYLSEEMKAELIKAIMQSGLTDEKKAELIRLISQISEQSLEQQKQILKTLQEGSTVSYKINGIEYSIRKNDGGTLTIGIKSLNGLKEVVIPDAMTIAGKTYPITEIANAAFKDNGVVEKVTLGNNITKIGDSAFENCKKLRQVIFSNAITTIGNKAFKGCVSLTSIKLPASLLKIGNSAFEGCTKLKSVSFNEGLISIGSKAFKNCKALKGIKLPKTLVEAGSYCFASCTELKTAAFASGSRLKTLGAGAFSQDKALKKIKLPDKLTAVAKKTFYKCTSLASVTGMENVTKIGDSVFEECGKIKTITLPARVQTIGKKAFYGCKNLKKVTIKSKAMTSIGTNAFKKCKKGISFKVPSAKVNNYKSLLKGKY